MEVEERQDTFLPMGICKSGGRVELEERREDNKRASGKALQGVLVGIRHSNRCSGPVKLQELL